MKTETWLEQIVILTADDEQHTTHFWLVECWWWNGKSVKPFGIYSFMHCKMWISSLFSLQHTPFCISFANFWLRVRCVKHSRIKWEIIKSTHSLLICTGLGATNEAKCETRGNIRTAHLDDSNHLSVPKSENISFYYSKWVKIPHFYTFEFRRDGFCIHFN